MTKQTEEIEALKIQRYQDTNGFGLVECGNGGIYKVSDVDPIITSLLEQIKELKEQNDINADFIKQYQCEIKHKDEVIKAAMVLNYHESLGITVREDWANLDKALNQLEKR